MSGLWQDFQDKVKLMRGTMGSCRCISNSLKPWVRVRLPEGWAIDSSREFSTDRFTLIQLDEKGYGLQWYVSAAPSDRAAILVLGASRRMENVDAWTKELRTLLNGPDGGHI